MSQGLRERKKEQTRRLLSDTARRLFADRGFEAVTVAEVARAADVSEATVFNYFHNKEDLVFGGLEAFEAELLASIRDRARGESILAAFARFISTPRGLLADPDPAVAEQLANITRVIEESPALLAREREIFAAYTDSLAALIAGETGYARRAGAAEEKVEPWVVANALIGLHRALVHFSRQQVLDGVRNPALSRRVRAETRRAVARLERGLGDFGVR